MVKHGLAGALSGPWYVVRTKPRQEDVALRNLLNQGYEAWLPMHSARRRRGPRWTIARGPLFPSYAFVRPGQLRQSLAPIRSTVGVLGIVRFGSQPAPMPQAAIDDLRAIEIHFASHAASPTATFAPGAPVRVVTGPFAGLEGIVSHSADERVAVLLQLLGREQRIGFHPDALDRAATA